MVYDAQQYVADKSPLRTLLSNGQSTNNAAALLERAGSPAFLLDMTELAIENFLEMLYDATGIDLRFLSGAVSSVLEIIHDLFGWVVGEPFDPQAALTAFVDLMFELAVYIPLRLLGQAAPWLRTIIDIFQSVIALFKGEPLPAKQGFPYTFDFTFETPVTTHPIVVALSRILQFFNPINWLEEGWTVATAAVQFIENALAPLANAIINAVTGVPDIIGGVVGDVWNAVTSLLGVANDAQSTGSTALSEVAIVKATLEGMTSGGASFVEKFDGPQETTLTGYTQVRWGSSVGTYGATGDGYGHFYGGFGNSVSIALINDTNALNTSSQRTGMKMQSHVVGGGNSLWLMNRVNAAYGDCQFIQIFDNSFYRGYMLGGVLSGVSGGVRDYYGRMRDPLNIGQD